MRSFLPTLFLLNLLLTIPVYGQFESPIQPIRDVETQEEENPFSVPTDLTEQVENPFSGPEDKSSTPQVKEENEAPPAENPFETPNTAPPTENPFQTPDAEPPAENPFQTPDTEPPVENPFQTPDTEPPVENPFQTPDTEPPTENPFQTPDAEPKMAEPIETTEPEVSTEDPFTSPKVIQPVTKESPVEAPKENPLETPKENPLETPQENPFETLAETPKEASPITAEKPMVNPADIQSPLKQAQPAPKKETPDPFAEQVVVPEVIRKTEPQTPTKPSFEDQFWEYLETNAYENWAPAPKTDGGFYVGESPHGAFLKTYFNRTAIAKPNELPNGSIIVKENYSVDRSTLLSITAMYRSRKYNSKGGNWYWVKYNADGTVASSSTSAGSTQQAGKVRSCIDCHADAEGQDFAFFNDN